MTKRTKKLSESEYQGIPYDRFESIKRHVNFEEKRWFKSEILAIPKYEKPIISKRIGWSNFIRNSVLAFKP